MTPAPPSPVLRAAPIALALTLLTGAAPARAQHYVYSGADSLHPRVQYADSSTSLNDRCAVRMTKLALKMSPVYVNCRPVGFC